jgi:tetratricopeptide (TPR) repeat protein
MGVRWERLRAAACCALALAWPLAANAQAEPAPRSAAAVLDLRFAEAAQDPERLGLLRAAETALARGDTGEAIAALDRAALMLHAADTEMGLVRAYVQQGEYRRALAFAAHTAGAHKDTPAAAALYAWLLDAGGQAAFAQRVLDEARARSPQDPVLDEARRRLAAGAATAGGSLLQGAHRMAPHGVLAGGHDAPPTHAKTVASGMLLPGGRQAVVPLSAASDGVELWVRNGLGQTSHAKVQRRLPALGVAVLALSAPLAAAELPPLSPRDPFAGSPGFVVAHVAGADAAPAWPRLYAGFLGAQATAPAGARRLGIAVPASASGAPVFDAAGRWAGIVLTAGDAAPAMLGVQRLREALGDPADRPDAVPANAARIGSDLAYEQSLRGALQVVAARPALQPVSFDESAGPVEASAELAGHAVLRADTVVRAPGQAGPLFATAGKFSAGNRQRSEVLGSVPGISFVGDPKHPRASGGSLPIAGQAVQGFSAIVSLGRNEFVALTDNGFGNKLNSPDALLMLHRLKADWASGKVARLSTLFLRDPERKLPFQIVNENSAERYLTGSDFDPESLQRVGDEWWIGDEFGPYVLRVDRDGKVLGLVDTVVGDKPYRGPDHYLNARLPNYPGDAAFEVRRSGGFEPMALSPDGRLLYPMFEWPLWDTKARDMEKRDGKPFTRILELDVATQRYTGRQWKYAFEGAGHVVSDFQLLDATTGLVIERDDATEGDTPACPNEPRTDCFTRPAKFKRIYRIDLARADAEGFVRKIAYIDLTRIANPKGLARLGPNEARFSMPHLGPEGLAIVDATHIVVVNDNNFPYSSGRTIGRPDDNELVLLDIGALLQRR